MDSYNCNVFTITPYGFSSGCMIGGVSITVTKRDIDNIIEDKLKFGIITILMDI